MGKQITFFVSIRADISFLKMLADNDLFVIRLKEDFKSLITPHQLFGHDELINGDYLISYCFENEIPFLELTKELYNENYYAERLYLGYYCVKNEEIKKKYSIIKKWIFKNGRRKKVEGYPVYYLE
ncbi:MAG: hypothetical protein J5584_05100 [Clostridia bacterium]|nr:hypothetical protein [Clostridia bacterium]